MQRISIFLLLLASLLIVVACADPDSNKGASINAQTGEISYAPIPDSILTPDSVDTRLGTLDFFW